MHGILSVEKAPSHRISQEFVPLLFEIGYFVPAQGLSLLLLLLEQIPQFHHRLVLALGGIVCHEGVDIGANAFELGLLEDNLAEFLGFDDDDGIFGGTDHNEYNFDLNVGRHLRDASRRTIVS